jgi:hypothetical protein
MFDHTHYVPILRWKQAEQFAVRDIFPWVRNKLTPLIEVPPWNAGALTSYPASIAKMWGSSPCFFDFGPYGISRSVSPEAFNEFFTECEKLALSVIPTVGTRNSDLLKRSIRAAVGKMGVCIRLQREDLQKDSFENDLRALINILAVELNMTDLVVDLKAYQGSDLFLAAMLSQIPNLAEWRTLTVASGAFRENLIGLPAGRHEIPRSEWLTWLTSVKNHALTRKPTFGDYTILHPQLTEPKDIMNVSASIRYTSFDYWVVMKGRGLWGKNSPGFAQYPFNADLLTMQPEFIGGWFSPGDSYIADIAYKKKQTGNPTTWLQAGISHHITYTTDQLTRLFVSFRG